MWHHSHRGLEIVTDILGMTCLIIEVRLDYASKNTIDSWRVKIQQPGLMMTQFFGANTFIYLTLLRSG